MKKLTQAMVCAAAVATGGVSSVALADSPLTANVGVTSNYIWRGVSQTNEGPAVSGGIDYTHSSGLFIGTWVSNESWTSDAGYEQDLYAGYNGSLGSFNYGIEYMDYTYPVGNGTDDFAEAIVTLGYGPVTFTYAPTVSKEASGSNQDDVYMSIAASFEVKKGLTVGVLAGQYDFDGGSANDYKHYQITLSKDDFVFAYDKVDPETADPNGVVDAPRFSVSWSKSFDL